MTKITLYAAMKIFYVVNVIFFVRGEGANISFYVTKMTFYLTRITF